MSGTGQLPGLKDGRSTVTIMQAAERCQVSRRTIYNWIEKGKLDWVRTAGGAVRIFVDSLFTDAVPVTPDAPADV